MRKRHIPLTEFEENGEVGSMRDVLKGHINDTRAKQIEKDLKVVTLGHDNFEESEVKEIARKLKVKDYRKIQMILVDCDGKKDGESWMKWIA